VSAFIWDERLAPRRPDRRGAGGGARRDWSIFPVTGKRATNRAPEAESPTRRQQTRPAHCRK